MRPLCTICLCAALATAARGQEDDTFQWLRETHATTQKAQSAAASSTRPVLVKPAADPALTGTILLSDGSRKTGQISTTSGKPLRIWIEEKHEYMDVELKDVARMEATVLWERDEQEYHFIASGSDVKEYTGKTYPARETAYTITLRSGETLSGGIVAPIYLLPDAQQQQTFILHKRAKGEVGQKLAQLMYVKAVEFSGRSNP